MSTAVPIIIDDDKVFDTISTRVLRFLKDNFASGQFNAFYDGDPLLIGISRLPAIIVETSSANTLIGPTGFDKWQETITIKIVVNKRDEVGAEEDTVLGYKRLKQLVGARDITTKKFIPESLMGILRTNFTLDDVVIHQDVTIDYGIGERGDELLTSEAHIQFTAHELIEIGQRT